VKFGMNISLLNDEIIPCGCYNSLMNVYKVPQLAWYNPRDLEFLLPDDWQVQMNYMSGYNRPALSAEQIGGAIGQPTGQKPLRELARGKKEAVIVFDDMSRITRAAKIVPFVLSELASAGMAEKNIRFICALGAHPALYRQEFIKKLGEEVVARYRCFNHNPFGNCVYAGTTRTHGTKLYINEEYMRCDLKIAIGGCVPHPNAGFGGGAKMIMPGISSFESISQNHNYMFPDTARGSKLTQGMGLFDQNLFRKDIEECAALAGIDFYINVIVNLWGETVALHAGEWREAYAAAVNEAKSHYRTNRLGAQDVVIANAYAKANEAAMGLGAAMPFLDMTAKNGNSIVIIGNAPEGQIAHYLLGRWGKRTSPKLTNPSQTSLPPGLKQIIFYTEYPHLGSSSWNDEAPVIYLSRWEDVLKTLQKVHGPDTRVGIIPDATNQYFE
jgi:lactate racemase